MIVHKTKTILHAQGSLGDGAAGIKRAQLGNLDQYTSLLLAVEYISGPDPTFVVLEPAGYEHANPGGAFGTFATITPTALNPLIFFSLSYLQFVATNFLTLTASMTGATVIRYTLIGQRTELDG